jgi:hypothetical protein
MRQGWSRFWPSGSDLAPNAGTATTSAASGTGSVSGNGNRTGADGAPDSLGITLWAGNRLLFSSRWAGPAPSSRRSTGATGRPLTESGGAGQSRRPSFSRRQSGNPYQKSTNATATADVTNAVVGSPKTKSVIT